MKVIRFRETYFIADDKNRVQIDVVCPIACGDCCSVWYTMPELAHLTIRRPAGSPCPNSRSSVGCRLKRTRRPISCRGYVCELSILALNGQVAPHEIDAVLSEKKQYFAFDVLHRQPDVLYIDLRDAVLPPDVETYMADHKNRYPYEVDKLRLFT